MFSDYAYYFKNPSIVKTEVMYALHESKDRCLPNSSKVLTEILIALKDVPSLFDTDDSESCDSNGNLEFEQQFTSIEEYLTHCKARTYFELEDYQTCAYVTRNSNDSKCMFLHYMSRYLIMHNESICERPNLFDTYQPLNMRKFMELVDELLILNVYGSEDDSEDETEDESHDSFELDIVEDKISVEQQEYDSTPMSRRCGRRQRSQRIEKSRSVAPSKKHNTKNTKNSKKSKTSTVETVSKTNTSAGDKKVPRMKREDPYLLWLTAIMLRKIERHEEAIQLLLKAIKIQPCHWNAWLDLSTLIRDIKTFETLTAQLGEISEHHWMQLIFIAHVYIDFQMIDGAVKIYYDILHQAHPVFKQWSYLHSQLAISHHNKRQILKSVHSFVNVMKADPYRMDNFDLLSNLMYVCDYRDYIVILAKHTAAVDRFRQETLCVLGNMYSLKCDHAKSVLYFKKVVRMNPYNVTAWTLLGHEYIEMKNSYAAIISYRQALKINIRDYRAWYGLGQIYELVKLPNYALFYFGHARALRPGDARMLLALGEMFDRGERHFEALACVYKALLYDGDGPVLLKLGKYYERYGNNSNQYIRDNFNTININALRAAFKDKNDEELNMILGKIFLYLGHHFMDIHNFDRAISLAEKCRNLCSGLENSNYSSELLENVNALINEIEVRMTATGNLSSTSAGALRARRFLFAL